MTRAQADMLRALASNVELLEVGRKAIEDTLIEWRDDRLSEPLRNNGFVVREQDGRESAIVRFGPETGLRIALLAIANHLEQLPMTRPQETR